MIDHRRRQWQAALAGLGGGLLAATADVLALNAMAALAAAASVAYRRARPRR